jgi:hypothetical protein
MSVSIGELLLLGLMALAGIEVTAAVMVASLATIKKRKRE